MRADPAEIGWASPNASGLSNPSRDRVASDYHTEPGGNAGSHADTRGNTMGIPIGRPCYPPCLVSASALDLRHQEA